MIYAIQRTGVHDQGIFGIYSDPEKAIERAKEVCQAEPDDYHAFWIHTYELDQPVEESGDVYAKISREGSELKVEYPRDQ